MLTVAGYISGIYSNLFPIGAKLNVFDCCVMRSPPEIIPLPGPNSSGIGMPP